VAGFAFFLSQVQQPPLKIAERRFTPKVSATI
jgi:hypothetical protein